MPLQLCLQNLPGGVPCPTKQRQEQQPTKVKYKTAITSGSYRRTDEWLRAVRKGCKLIPLI